jgi:hypothetical protein
MAAAAGGAVPFDRPVVDRAGELTGDRLGERIGLCLTEVHPPSGPVSLQAVMHVESLLEVLPERQVDEGPAGGGEFHAGRQAALDHGQVAGRQVPVEMGHVSAYLDALGSRQGSGVDARASDDEHPKGGNLGRRLRVGVDQPAEQVAADAGAAHGHDTDLLVRRIAELPAQLVAVGNVPGVEPGDIAGEPVVVLHPVTDQREPVTEAVGDDIVRVADEQGQVADPRVAGNLLDHLGVVVGGQRGFRSAAFGHRQPADEVGEPAVGEALELGILVEEVVDLPRFVADHAD